MLRQKKTPVPDKKSGDRGASKIDIFVAGNELPVTDFNF